MIVALIKQIAEGLPVSESPNVYPTFIHGEREIQIYLADEILGVTISLDEPIISNDIIKQGGYIEEEYPIIMMFTDKTELDYTPEQHQTVILQMRALSKRFLNRLLSSTYGENVREVKLVSRTDIKNVFDTNKSGVILRLTVVPFNSDTACL
jgi:hypothetical protein